MAAIVNEPAFRGWIQRSIDECLRGQGLKPVDAPDHINSANREGAKSFGKNGWFDYLRELPNARCLILELKVNEDGRLRAFSKKQHLLNCALEISGVPLQYCWNSVPEIEILDFFNADQLLKACAVELPSKTQKSVVPSPIDLEKYLLSLLGVSGGGAIATTRPLHLLKQLASKNASCVLIALAFDELKFSVSEITPEFIQNINLLYPQITLPDAWESLNADQLSFQLNVAIGSVLTDVSPELSDEANATAEKDDYSFGR